MIYSWSFSSRLCLLCHPSTDVLAAAGSTSIPARLRGGGGGSGSSGGSSSRLRQRLSRTVMKRARKGMLSGDEVSLRRREKPGGWCGKRGLKRILECPDANEGDRIRVKSGCFRDNEAGPIEAVVEEAAGGSASTADDDLVQLPDAEMVGKDGSWCNATHAEQDVDARYVKGFQPHDLQGQHVFTGTRGTVEAVLPNGETFALAVPHKTGI